MLYTKDLKKALKENVDRKYLKDTASFAIDVLIEQISENKDEITQNVKRLLQYYIDLETLKLLDKKDQVISFVDSIEEISYYDMSRTKQNLDFFLELERSLNKQEEENDNIFVSKKVMNINKLVLANKYAFNYGVNKISKGISKVIKK